MLNFILSFFNKLRIKRATPTQRAEILRDKFYYIGKNVKLHTIDIGTEPYLISIHDNVTIASNVHFITHDVSCFNMARYLGLDSYCLDKVGSIELYENCFIGAETILMPNCSVGRNSVVAAGSIVTKRIPDNEVWAGAPAKFVMTVQEYANKVKCNAEKYPWVDKNNHKILDVSHQELVEMRQNFFFKSKK